MSFFVIEGDNGTGKDTLAIKLKDVKFEVYADKDKNEIADIDELIDT